MKYFFVQIIKKGILKYVEQKPCVWIYHLEFSNAIKHGAYNQFIIYKSL